MATYIDGMEGGKHNSDNVETKQKKAYLVDFSIMTRVIAESSEQAIKEAIKKLLPKADEYFIHDNVIEVEEDTEMPYEE